jgi:hypothetical protein
MVNLTAQAYVNAKRSDVLPAPTWQLKFQIVFLYPKRPKPGDVEVRTQRLSHK